MRAKSRRPLTRRERRSALRWNVSSYSRCACVIGPSTLKRALRAQALEEVEHLGVVVVDGELHLDPVLDAVELWGDRAGVVLLRDLGLRVDLEVP